jgi:hypothetical protein
LTASRFALLPRLLDGALLLADLPPRGRGQTRVAAFEADQARSPALDLNLPSMI